MAFSAIQVSGSRYGCIKNYLGSKRHFEFLKFRKISAMVEFHSFALSEFPGIFCVQNSVVRNIYIYFTLKKVNSILSVIFLKG